MNSQIINAIVLFLFLNFVIIPFRIWYVNSRNKKENMLKELYGPIYSNVLKHKKYLKATVEVFTDETQEGVPIKEEYPEIQGDFNKVMPVIEEIVTQNIYLLTKDDMRLWHEYLKSEMRFQELFDSEYQNKSQVIDYMVEYHKKFIEFINSAEFTYLKLYLKKDWLKMNKNKLKKKLDSIEKNKFYEQHYKDISRELYYQHLDRLEEKYKNKSI